VFEGRGGIRLATKEDPMENRIGLVGAVVAAALLITAAPAKAQIVHMSSSKKQVYMLGLAQGAKNLAAKGETKKAKVVCFAAVKFLYHLVKMPMWLRRNRPALQQLAGACDPLFKNHPGNSNNGAAIQKQYGPQLHEYGLALRFPPVWKRTPGKSYKDIKQVVESRPLYKKAIPYVVDYVEKMPSPDKCLQGKCGNVQKTWPDVVAIVFARSASEKLIKSHAIPTIVSELKAIAGKVNKGKIGSLLNGANDLKRWVRLLRQAQSGHPGIARAERAMKGFVARAEKLQLARLRAARMPKDKYRGGGAGALKATAKRVWQRRFKEKVLKVVIRDERWSPAMGEGWWEKNIWKWGVFSRIHVSLAVQQRIKGKTMYRVFPATFARQRRAGGWSKPYMIGHGYPYLILEKHIR
jgi:hypothetical protein